MKDGTTVRHARDEKSNLVKKGIFFFQPPKTLGSPVNYPKQKVAFGTGGTLRESREEDKRGRTYGVDRSPRTSQSEQSLTEKWLKTENYLQGRTLGGPA